METLNLSNVIGTVAVKKDYFIEVPETPYIFMIAGVSAGTSGFDYDARNVSAVVSRVHECKHYHRMRGKYWTQHAGRDIYFAIPKERIELCMDCTYSYPNIKIDGHTYHLNVSGGTFPESCWTDYIRPICHSGIKYSKRALSILNNNALSPEEVLANGYGMDIREDGRENEFIALASESMTKKKLKEGDSVYLGNGYTYEGSKGPFCYKNHPKRKQYIVCEYDRYSTIRIKYPQINWTRTAKENGYSVPDYIIRNRIGEVLEYQ